MPSITMAPIMICPCVEHVIQDVEVSDSITGAPTVKLTATVKPANS